MKRNQRGLGLIELLVSMLLISIAGFAIARSMTTALQLSTQSSIYRITDRLASDKIEEYSRYESSTLDDTFDATESSVSVAGHELTFTRVTNVTVNADGSKTVEVSVSTNSSLFPSTTTHTTSFAVWE